MQAAAALLKINYKQLSERCKLAWTKVAIEALFASVLHAASRGGPLSGLSKGERRPPTRAERLSGHYFVFVSRRIDLPNEWGGIKKE